MPLIRMAFLSLFSFLAGGWGGARRTGKRPARGQYGLKTHNPPGAITQGLHPARTKFTLPTPARGGIEVSITVERRKNDIDRRGAAEAREERNYVAARRRIVALEKALDMIVGSVAAPGHQLDPGKISQFRQGIDVARALLGARPPNS